MKKKTFVVDFNSNLCNVHEVDMDDILRKYDFEKVRICNPAMYGIFRNPFANRIQWVIKDVSPLTSLIIAFRIGIKTRYWFGKENIRVGWAIE